ncbi:MAG TPA: hypothetical protein DHV14_07875 [Micrococcales bacterium]|nr:hypothetical protein [Micrococcales bacterium]
MKGLAQVGLGASLLFAGTSHLTVAREEFQAQVPDWFPIDHDVVVLVSRVVELALGAGLVATWQQPYRRRLGILVALFFVVIFPGNVAQYLEHKDGFGLDTDEKRLLRLPFQAVLVAWALLATRQPRSER